MKKQKLTDLIEKKYQTETFKVSFTLKEQNIELARELAEWIFEQASIEAPKDLEVKEA